MVKIIVNKRILQGYKDKRMYKADRLVMDFNCREIKNTNCVQSKNRK